MEYITLSLIGVCVIWLSVLTYFTLTAKKSFTKLTENGKRQNMDEIIQALIDYTRRVDNDLKQIKKEQIELKMKGAQFFQKMGLVRYNPFGKIGSDRSFVISLLDGENSGVVVNFIYTPDGMRIYSREIMAGNAKDGDLSEEEKDAVLKAS